MPLHNVHAWTPARSTRARRQGPCARTSQICFTNVHFWRRPPVDICEVHAWTSTSSRAVGALFNYRHRNSSWRLMVTGACVTALYLDQEAGARS